MQWHTPANPATQEARAGGSHVQGQLRQLSQILSQNEKIKKALGMQLSRISPRFNLQYRMRVKMVSESFFVVCFVGEGQYWGLNLGVFYPCATSPDLFLRWDLATLYSLASNLGSSCSSFSNRWGYRHVPPYLAWFIDSE